MIDNAPNITSAIVGMIIGMLIKAASDILNPPKFTTRLEAWRVSHGAASLRVVLSSTSP